MRKISTLILILFLAVSVPLTFASYVSATKSSIPEFSLQLGAHPYDVPPVTRTDPYTGQTVTVTFGYHVTNESVEVTIKNQPFTSTIDSSGNYTNLYYNVRFKGHYTGEWQFERGVYNASKSDYTVVSISLQWVDSFQNNGELDFQVRALIGHQDRKAYDSILPPEMKYYYEFAGETGEWSSTQTIKIGENPTATPTQTPTLPPSEPTQNPTAAPEPTQNPTLMQPNTQTDVTLGVDAVIVVLVVLVTVLVVVVALLAVKVNSQKTQLSAKQSADGWVHKWDD